MQAMTHQHQDSEINVTSTCPHCTAVYTVLNFVLCSNFISRLKFCVGEASSVVPCLVLGPLVHGHTGESAM